MISTLQVGSRITCRIALVVRHIWLCLRNMQGSAVFHQVLQECLLKFRDPGPSLILTWGRLDYGTQSIFRRCLGLTACATQRELSDRGVLGACQGSCLLSFSPLCSGFIVYAPGIKNCSQLVLRSSLSSVLHNPHQEDRVFEECL